MKSYEELINQVKDLIRKNKTSKALEILAKEQLATVDQQLILINSRYSKLKEEQTLGILDDDTAQRRLNKINVELLALAERIGKLQNVVQDTSEVEESQVLKTPTPTPPTTNIKKPTPPPPTATAPAEGKSKSKLFIGATIGILLVALVGYFGTQQAAKKAETKKQEEIKIAKKNRAKVVRDSIAKVEFEKTEKAKEEAINRAKNIAVGKTFEGGIIFYVDPSGQHGLIMAKGDQSDKAIDWFHGTTGKALATDTEIYDGESNTELLTAKFKEENHPAQLCKNFEFGGFSDWYLPSKNELDKLYEYNQTLPKAQRLEPAYYWSSTEMSNQDVYYRSFHNGKSYTWIKGNKAKVRAVRKF